MIYNTEKEKLRLSEYGRIVQDMVNFTMQISDRDERLSAARKIVSVMRGMVPPKERNAETDYKLWNHLAYLSNYQLDIDWPCEIEAQTEDSKPIRMDYPMHAIKYRQYGYLLEELVRKTGEKEVSDERSKLISLAANQMRKDLYYWNKNSLNEGKISDDMYELSQGKIQLHEGDVQFSNTVPMDNGMGEVKSRANKRNNSRRRR